MDFTKFFKGLKKFFTIPAIGMAFLIIGYMAAIAYILLVSASIFPIPADTILTGITGIATTVGGVITALIGGEAITANSTSHQSGAISRGAVPDLTEKDRNNLVVSFFFGWCLVGCVCLVGGFATGDVTGVLLPIGWAWLGVLATSVITYISVNPNSNTNQPPPSPPSPPQP